MADEIIDPSLEGGANPAPPVKKSNPFIPLAVVLVATPVISFVMVNFVFMPKVSKNLKQMVEEAKAAVVNADASAPMIPPSGEAPKAPEPAAKPDKKEAPPAKDGHGAAAPAPAKDAHGAAPKDAGGAAGDKNQKVTYTKDGWGYNFSNVVSNLTGSLGTKYVKCAFTVLSDDQNIGVIVEENKSKLRDAALSVLSARSLADMESAGAKNILRSELAANFNKALNSNVVKQIFFTEFVIQ